MSDLFVGLGLGFALWPMLKLLLFCVKVAGSFVQDIIDDCVWHSVRRERFELERTYSEDGRSFTSPYGTIREWEVVVNKRLKKLEKLLYK